MTDLALDHPLCSTNVTAYVGQTAEMHCCLARLDRELSVSWIRQRDVVVMAHGLNVFTSDSRVKVNQSNGVWGVRIKRVGHEDAGVYECQTNSEVKGSVNVQLNVMETTAEILPSSRYVRSGGSLRLSCRVYLGEGGPDEDYRRSAVVHWFHGQRLLDPAVEGPKSRISLGSEVTKELNGWLQIDRVTPYDSGNYTCVPSYAIPAWTEIHILHEENQAGLHNGVSEVKVDVTSSATRTTTTAQTLAATSLLFIPLINYQNRIYQILLLSSLLSLLLLHPKAFLDSSINIT